MIKGADNISRKPYLGSIEISEVWLGNIPIYPESLRPLYDRQYLTMEVLEDGTTFHFNENGLSYSIDRGITWNSLGKNVNTPSLNTGGRIMFKGQLVPHSQQYYGIGNFVSDKTFNVEGNPMSLIFGDNFAGVTDLTGYDYAFDALFTGQKVVNTENLSLVATTLSSYCYSNMFNACITLITTPVLPATVMASGCYSHMFYKCTSLVNAPTLPATTLAESCYDGMFVNCSSLTTAPELPATTLAIGCYNSMFWKCTSLTTAPELPATTLVESCYNSMFWNCTNLNSITCLATNISAAICTTNWVEDVASSGTFTKAASMNDWTTGTSGIPSGWTVQNA